MERFVDLHRHMFGTYEGELYLRPSEDVFRRTSGTLQEWLQENGIDRLVPMFIGILNTLGYE